MNKGSYVFSQLVKALDEFVFLRIVKKYDGDKFYGLGLGKNATRSNLSKANNNRDYRIFEEFATWPDGSTEEDKGHL